MDAKVSSQKLGEMPIPKLLATMSAPAILSMLVQALYNVVDSIFVSRISEDALTALSLAFPMQTMVLAFSIGIGIGTSSIVSRRLGQCRKEDAVKTAQNGLFMALIVSVFWLIFGYLISMGFAMLFSEKGSAIYEYTLTYLYICVCFSAGSTIEVFFNKLNQSMGNMKVPMITQLIGAITNICLDPLFIFGVRKWDGIGVAGAALATVIGQTVAMAYAVIKFFKSKNELSFSMNKFRPEKKYCVDIIKLGFPVTVLNSIASFATMAMNAILISLSKTAVAVLGIYFKLQSFVFMPLFGLNQGSLPIEAYNYGANNKKRFYKTYYLCLSVSLTIMLIGFALFMAIPDKLLLLFDASDEMLEIGTHALRLICISFIPASFGVVTINMFQSLGRGFTSMVMSVLRQVGFLLPLALIFAKTTGLKYVWLSYPIAEFITLLIFMPIAFLTIKKQFAKLELATPENIAIENNATIKNVETENNSQENIDVLEEQTSDNN